MHYIETQVRFAPYRGPAGHCAPRWISAAAQMAPTRTWEELKQETQRRVDKNLGPVGGLKSDDAREALTQHSQPGPGRMGGGVERHRRPLRKARQERRSGEK